MRVFRICRKPFTDLCGEGARRFGGRWNSPGLPLVYAAESVALAVLEIRVHLDLDYDLIPDDYVLVTIEIDSISMETMQSLPPDTQASGDAWLSSRRSLIMRVPSVIAPNSMNVLINPMHPEMVGVTIASVVPLAFDRRLWAR